MDRILVLSYYHPLIAGGGHRPHQISIEDLRRGREVAFVCVSPTDLAQVQALDEDALYTRCACFHFDAESGGRLVPLTRHARAMAYGATSLDELLATWRPDYIRSHAPLEVFLPLLEKLQAGGVPLLYDQMDMWSAFAVQPWGSSDAEQHYFELADAVTTISNFMVERAPRGVNVHLLANAISSTFLSAVAPNGNGLPPDDAGVKRILYMGAIWPDWFDWELAYHMAENRPAYHFTFIGSTTASADEDDGRQTQRLAARLAAYPNVSMIDEVPHMALVSWLNKADIGIIPFVVNDLTMACSPLKVFEYIGAGLPVVSTALPEIACYPMVTTGVDYAQLVQHLDAPGRRQLSAQARRDAQEFINLNTWKQRVDKLDSIVGALL
jgi:glycosyltransferase involved in cell wall biosynthesis